MTPIEFGLLMFALIVSVVIWLALSSIEREAGELVELANLINDANNLHAAYSHSQQQFLDGEKERDTLRSQLPDDMQNCTIVLERCDVGHGQLTATNWVKHPCTYCKIDTLRELVREAQTYIEPTSPWRRVWNERAEKALEQL